VQGTRISIFERVALDVSEKPFQRLFFIGTMGAAVGVSSSNLEFFAQAFTDQRGQPVEPFAHVAGFQRHEYFQAARKTQPDRPKARSKTAASAACFSSATAARAPPGNSNTIPAVGRPAGVAATTASNHRIWFAGAGAFVLG
jgi:hypothetical protein